MEDSSQQQRPGKSAPVQLDFSGRVLSDTDIPEQLDFSGKALPEQDTLESPISPHQQSQDQDASQPSDQQSQNQDVSQPSVLSDQEKFPQTISSGTAAALNAFSSVLTQPSIPVLPQYPNQSSHSPGKRRLPAALIGIAAALVAAVLFVLIAFPGSHIPQVAGRAAANTQATATIGGSSSPSKTTPQAPGNNPTQPPANNGNPNGGSPNNGNPNPKPPVTAPTPPQGTNPTPTPPPVTPPPTGVFTVSPATVQVNNNNDCKPSKGGFQFKCVLTLTAGQSVPLWTANPTGLGAAVIFPLTGSLLLGGQQQVTVLLPNCMNGGSISFTAGSTTVVVPFQC